MEEIAGKMVFSTLAEVVNPTCSAVLVIDMQNDFCSPEGACAKRGHDISMIRETLPSLVRFLDEARKYGVPIFFSQAVETPGGQSNSPAWLRFTNRFLTGFRMYIEGTWGAELLPELRRRPEEAVVTKYRSSAFANTTLDTLLRSMQIQTAIVTGMTAPGCVASTVRAASDNDYYVVVVSDCVASLGGQPHQTAMNDMALRWDGATSQEIVREWSKLVAA